MADGNQAVALLGNSIATGAGLFVLISLCIKISGAHFNPAVTLLSVLMGHVSKRVAAIYIVIQIAGACVGIMLVHFLFDLPTLQISENARTGPGIFASEIVSTLILLVVITLGSRNDKHSIPILVAMTVTAGYWFTSSTFFANPAVTIGRSLTDTFVGIRPTDVPFFIAAQLAAVTLMSLFLKRS